MADRRVASVELNEAGKAAKLVLAPGWTYQGATSFDLKNVEHGHQIVRGAEPDGTVAVNSRRARTATRQPPSEPGAAILAAVLPPEPSADTKPVSKPIGPRDGPMEWVYRLALDPLEGHAGEARGWLKTTVKKDAKALAQHTWGALKNSCFSSAGRGKEATPKTHVVKSFRWTNAHEADARKRGESGAPYGGNYG
jgi:hypothetical protein